MTTESQIDTRIAALPFWQGRPRLEPLPGGLSNVSFVATDRAGRYVVRLTRDFPFHQVFREREVAVARAAHAAGFAPEIVYAGPGLMVSRYIEARALTPADIPANIGRIVALLRRFHALTPGAPFAFDVFAVNRGYGAELRGHAAPADLAEWAGLNARLEGLAGRRGPVFAHHDLLAGNWLDDGSRLWLIDFEYAGIGDPLFDLANLSSNAQLNPDQAEALLAAYFGREPDAALRRAHVAMEAASLLREALWSLVSAIHISERDVDYAGYAALNFDRLREKLRQLQAPPPRQSRRGGAGRRNRAC